MLVENVATSPSPVILVAHSGAVFDHVLLQGWLGAFGDIPLHWVWVDSLPICRVLNRHCEWNSLSSLRGFYLRRMFRPHCAKTDARSLWEVLMFLVFGNTYQECFDLLSYFLRQFPQ